MYNGHKKRRGIKIHACEKVADSYNDAENAELSFGVGCHYLCPYLLYVHKLFVV
ncbi:MAG: hypothetical protein WBL02_02835 [Methanomethylovorans sp.]|uniref:hypothetical protein n=1 Tax=Methanomethylovorans sp. TaxID=2758717 RepID=UPI003C76C105